MQYMLYSELQNITGELDTRNSSAASALHTTDTMQNDLAKISQNSEVTAYHTAQAAFYAKKNAELTDALGFMAAFK